MSDSAAVFAGRYGPWALVAGASEGLGEQFARPLAARGLNVVLIARRAGVLRTLADDVTRAHAVEVRELVLDLARADAVAEIERATADLEIGLLVYNAAVSTVGAFLDHPIESYLAELEVNCRKPLELSHRFGCSMAERGRGGILLMSSLAGSQGSPYLSHYGATKAWNTVLAEGLWGELGGRGVDVLACRAGATRTPRYLADTGGGGSAFVPEMEAEEVVAEALASLGRTPSMIPGRANRLASFLMQRLLSRRAAVTLMGRASRSAGVGAS
jgi:short-subunit dehydrogenase